MSLSGKQKFLALSYTWGNPVDELYPSSPAAGIVEDHILCSGYRLAVTQNLHAALWQLREKREYSRLWVDAICINQKDDKEVNRQLSLMPCIYRDASWVVIWLGKADAITHEAIQTLSDLQFRERLIPSALMAPRPAAASLDFLSQRQQQVFTLFFRRTWFGRVWTLQEVILAKNTRCFCGPDEFDIGDASICASILLRTHSETHKLIDGRVLLDSLGGAACISAWLSLTWPGVGFGSRALLRYRKIDFEEQVSRTLKWFTALELLVHEARQRNCTQPGDKVLAPLAMALHDDFIPKTTDFSTIVSEAQTVLDCRLPASELHTKFTRFIVDGMSSLDILSRVQGDDSQNSTARELGLPSWVPQYQQAGTTSLIDDLLFTQYNAAKHLGPYCRAENDQGDTAELRVRAIVLGPVVQISSHDAPCDTIPAWFSHVWKSARYKQELEQDIRRDLVHAVTQRLQARLESAIEREITMNKKREEYLKYHLSAFAMVQLNTTVLPKSPRRLFLFHLCGQHMFGLAPSTSRESDHLCILRGASTPFIVRETPERDKYTLVGEALAENFMRGEVESLNFSGREIVLV
ncbi:heterokaryon incompatibility protein-domain-containing protein [Aspergillus varians]